MEHDIIIVIRTLTSFYVLFNCGLIFFYAKTVKEIKFSEITWLMFFGFLVLIFLGLNFVKNEWEE